jgi:hypothetical protein
MKRSEREFKLRMLLKAIVLVLNTHLMMKSLKIKSQNQTRVLLNQKFNKYKDG